MVGVFIKLKVKGMKTKVNVHLLPLNNIDKSTLVLGVVDNYCVLTKDIIDDDEWRRFGKPHNLYFTLPQSDLEISKIKGGDWYINNGKILQCSTGCINEQPDCEKIVACTDDSIQVVDYDNQHRDYNPSKHLLSIPQLFIKHYITEYNKGNVVKSVDIELEEYAVGSYGLSDGEPTIDLRLKLTSANEVVVVPIVDKMYNKEEVKQLCYQAFINHKCVDGKIKPSEAMDLIEPFNEWCNKNLKL